MTRGEASGRLHWLMWHLSDSGYGSIASIVSDAHLRVDALKWPSSLCSEYAGMLLPPGRRGRARLALLHPYEARALALCAAILRSVERA